MKSILHDPVIEKIEFEEGNLELLSKQAEEKHTSVDALINELIRQDLAAVSD